MNAHQRRKARRAKDREPATMFLYPAMSMAWDRALKGGDRTVRVDIPLIRGEIGTIEG